MNFLTKTCLIKELQTECLVVSVYADKSLSEAAKFLDLEDGCISQVIELGDLTFKAGKSIWLTPATSSNYKRLLVVCSGESATSLSEKDLSTTARSVAVTLQQKSIKHAAWSIENTSSITNKRFAEIIAQSFTTSTYLYSETKTQNVTPIKLSKLTLHSVTKLNTDWKNGLVTGHSTGEGINFTRELGNLPANICTPSYLAKQAQNSRASTSM
jgi:leucyl aminopeptidase